MSAFANPVFPRIDLTSNPAGSALNCVSRLDYAHTKNAPATPLESTLTRLLDLKSFRFLSYKKHPGAPLLPITDQGAPPRLRQRSGEARKHRGVVLRLVVMPDGRAGNIRDAAGSSLADAALRGLSFPFAHCPVNTGSGSCSGRADPDGHKVVSVGWELVCRASRGRLRASGDSPRSCSRGLQALPSARKSFSC